MKKIITRVFQNRSWTLFAVFFAALLIRGLFIFTLQDGFYFYDSVDYSKAAVNLLNYGELGESYQRPPAYPVFLAGIYLFFGDSILAVRIVESVLGALLAVMTVLIGRRVAGATAGVLAGILWSIYPLGVFIAGLVYPTTLFATLLACGVLTLPSPYQEPSRQRFFLAGVIFGVAALTIPIAIVTIAAISLCTLLWYRGKRVLLVSLLVLGSAIALVPCAIRDYYTYGRVVFVEPRLLEHLPPVGSAEDLRNSRLESIGKNPDKYAFRIASEFFHFWKVYPDRITMDRPGFREQLHETDPRVVKDTIFGVNDLIKAVSILSTGPLFFFAILGTAAMWFERERRRDLALLWAIILSVAVGYSFFFSQTRYRIPVEPYIAILSAYGLKKTWDLLAARFARGEQVEVRRVRGSTFEVEKR